MREALEEALQESLVVAIDREDFEEGGELGYVLAVGASLFVCSRSRMRCDSTDSPSSGSKT